MRFHAQVWEGGKTIRAVSQETCQLDRSGMIHLTGILSGANTEVVMLATKMNSTALSLSLSQRIATGAFAGLFGFMLLYAAAFANSDILHNAAHDTRHAIVVPCH
jgi:cobalt transporter subunit CbtB